ncbi:hypothetical protein AB0G05_07025 [Nonomuraea wenchangensis]
MFRCTLQGTVEAHGMADITTDPRIEPLVAEIRTLLEERGYRLPSGGDHIRGLVLARVGIALENLVEIFEGRTW